METDELTTEPEGTEEPIGSPWTEPDDPSLNDDYGSEYEPDPAEPDLTEQEQALAAKMGAQAESPNGDGWAPEVGEADPDAVQFDEGSGTWIDAEGQPVDPSEVTISLEDGREIDGYGRELAPDDGANDYEQTTGDPRLDAVYDYLAAKEDQDREEAILRFADENPDLKQPEILAAVEGVAEKLAERAGDPDLATDPLYVEQALYSVRSQRATPPEIPAAQARNQGATLETDAGASVGSSQDPADAKWERIKGAPGQAFPI